MFVPCSLFSTLGKNQLIQNTVFPIKKIMVFERKSAVSAKGTWFWGDSPFVLEEATFSKFGSAEPSPSRILVKRSQLNRLVNERGSKFYVSPRNKTAIRTANLDAGKQQVLILIDNQMLLFTQWHTSGLPVWLLRMYI